MSVGFSQVQDDLGLTVILNIRHEFGDPSGNGLPSLRRYRAACACGS